MQLKQALKYFGAVGSAYFTAIVAVICLIFLIIGTPESSESVKLLQPERLVLILALSFVMSAGSTVYRFANLGKTLAICLHAAIYNAGFFAFLWITVTGYEENIGKKFVLVTVGTLVLAAIYTVVTLLVRMSERALIGETAAAPKVKAAARTKAEPATEGKSTAPDEKAKKSKKNKKEPYKSQFS